MTYRNLYIQLARLGDQLNLLPLLWRDAQEGGRSAMMVQEQYLPHLENSYCDILPWKGDTHDIQGAVAEASKLGKPTCTQVLGPPDMVRKWTYEPAGLEHAVCTSYQKDAWRVAKRLGDWDYCFPLVFDRRSPEREYKLIPKSKKRFIIASLDGISSPFPYKALVLELLKLTGCNIIDLSTIKAERFYDLLGLYERARCLVAIDSAPLHLSRAVPELPVVALANDKPMLWNGSSWRPQFIWYCRYSDFPARAHEMVNAIKGIEPLKDLPRIVHVWQAYEGGTCKVPKSDFAQWIATPIEIGSCGKDSAQPHMNDPKRFPYLKDAIRMGLQRARDNDWVCVTRPGTTIEKGTTQLLVSKPACFAYRIAVKDGERTHVPVGDLFCGTKVWWRNVWGEIPDFVMGTDHYWPHVLLALFREQGAFDATGCCHREL